MQILFEPKYAIGDTVVLKLNPEMRMVVDGYSLHRVNDVGEVIAWSYSLYDEDGKGFYFRDIDLELVEAVEE